MKCLYKLGTIHSISSSEATPREYTQLQELSERSVLSNLYKKHTRTRYRSIENMLSGNTYTLKVL